MECRGYVLILHALCACMIFVGDTLAVSNTAFRNLNAKVNLLKSSYQREIDDLKFEMLDLKTELDLERAKTARLEALINGTDPTVDTSSDLTRVKPEDKIAQRQHKDDSQVLHVLDRAFHDLKQEVKQVEAGVKTKFEIQTNASNTLTSTVANISSEMTRVGKLAKGSGEGVAEIRDDLQKLNDNVVLVKRLCKEEIDAVNNDLVAVVSESKNNTNGIGENRIAILHLQQELLQVKQEDTTVALTTTTTLPLETTTDDRISKCRHDRSSKCLQAIRAGGNAMAKLLYVGVTVKRGKDWKWGDADGGGYGKVKTIMRFWSRVRWDNNGHLLFYRMGLRGAYDLMIVEDKFDFCRCPD